MINKTLHRKLTKEQHKPHYIYIYKRLNCSTTTSQITISLQKDYNYNQIDGYFA